MRQFSDQHLAQPCPLPRLVQQSRLFCFLLAADTPRAVAPGTVRVSACPCLSAHQQSQCAPDALTRSVTFSFDPIANAFGAILDDPIRGHGNSGHQAIRPIYRERHPTPEQHQPSVKQIGAPKLIGPVAPSLRLFIMFSAVMAVSRGEFRQL